MKRMKEIHDSSADLIELSNEALGWVEKYADQISQSSLRESTKRIRRTFKKVQSASRKRPATGIFGQSQVGKSYLIKNIAKPQNASALNIIAGQDESMDFIREINPEGGKESTGCVTRFTTAPWDEEQTPIKAELLSQLSIASILVNGYYSDLKDLPADVDMDVQEKSRLFNEARSAQGENDQLHEDDSAEFVQYIKSVIPRDNAVRERFERIQYFKTLTEELHQVSPRNRFMVLEPLWGKNEFITSLFKQLTELLDTLDFETDVWLKKDAVAPRDRTVLDVQRIKEIPKSSKDKIKVQGKTFKEKEVSRALFSAVIKEVELVIYSGPNESHSFIQNGDLLDFPGGRSREVTPLHVFMENDEENKMELFIRGKVAYLFDIYLSEYGVSSLIYCMDHEQSNVKQMPLLLGNWVAKYIGGSASERRERIDQIKNFLTQQGIVTEQLSPLLVVMTKFNVEMGKVDNAADTQPEEFDGRWQARIGENFVNFMNRPVEDKWVTNWTEKDQGFPFVFPIRDPFYSTATFDGWDLVREDGLKREDGVRPGREKMIKDMGISFVQSPVVQKHIHDPERLWNEVASPNETGVGYLLETLECSAHPLITETKLIAELQRAKSDLLTTLSPFVVSGDLESDLKAARKKSVGARMAIASLSTGATEALTAILEGLVLEQNEIWKLLYNYNYQIEEEKAKPEDSIPQQQNKNMVNALSAIGVPIEAMNHPDTLKKALEQIYPDLTYDEIKNLIRDNFDVDIDQLISSLGTMGAEDAEERFSSVALSYWSKRIISFFDEYQEIISKLNPAQREGFLSAISEIIKATKTFRLQERLDDISKDLFEGVLEQGDYDMVASCYCDVLNAFLFTAGWKFGNQPLRGSKGELIFSPKVVYEAPVLGAYSKAKENAKGFAKDWAIGVMELFPTNVRFDHDVREDFNEESNGVIADLLDRIEGTALPS